MRGYRAFAGPKDHHQIVVRLVAGVGRGPVMQDVRVGILGQVVPGVDHVSRPCLDNGEVPAGQVPVVGDRRFGPGRADHVGQLGPDEIEIIVSVGVQVETVAQQDHTHHGAIVVDHGNLVAVPAVPEDVERVVPCADVLGNDVRPPGDARVVDGVRHGVAPLQVVEGIGEVRPHLADVRDVAVVQRS